MANLKRARQSASQASHRSSRRSPDVRATQSPSERHSVAREWEHQGHEWEAEGHDRVSPNPGPHEDGYGQTRQGYEWDQPEKGRTTRRLVKPAQTQKPHGVRPVKAKKR